MDIRTISIQKGLEPPTYKAAYFFEFGCCGHKAPSITELALAAKSHRWADLRAEQKAAFDDYMHLTTSFEKDLLSLFRLPSIEIVRESILNNDIPEGKPWEFNRAMVAGFERIIAEWITSLFGKRKKIVGMKEGGDEPLFDYHAKQSYTIGANHTKKEMLANLPVGVPAEMVIGIFADPEEKYFKAMLTEAMKRVKTRIAKDNFKIVTEALRDMARNGEWPIKVARYLHKTIGEGDSWYWLRLARSEAVLATNAAHNAMAEKNRTNYEKWSAAPNACVICSYMNGKTWKRGEGPEPVASTHPHCGCTRIPLYSWDGRTEEEWTRDPYKERYTREEIELMRG